jgi:hypothetical protein
MRIRTSSPCQAPMVRRGSRIWFEGFLFEYGPASLTPSFFVGLVRQFDLVDSDGEHEGYVQVHCRYEFGFDDELTAAGRYNEWWFADDDEPFEAWFAKVRNHPVWRILLDRSPSSFTVRQENV